MKINYGIYIGTSSASIAKMEAGVPCIIRSNTLKDSTPMAVFVNRRGAIQVGDAAMNAHKSERLNAIKNWNSGNDNSFMEFTRTLGSDAKYESNNAECSFLSEELLAELIKHLLSYENDQDINATVITVPAAFKYNQIEAVRKAGYLAGLKQIEILQEPVAAAMAYCLYSKNKDGYWLVFDFGVGAFDVALLRVSDGIIQIIDIDGNQFYGSGLIDEAIVDELFIPHLQENFVLQVLLADDNKSRILRNSMKFYAEEIKEQLSFSDETSILTNLGDIPSEDDEGNELELDMIVTASELENAIAPVFQKAIDISLELLKRNNLDGSKLTSLILAGKPTMSPILRKMLFDQICKPDTSVDPMTVIVKGAAIYASTIDLKDELKNLKRDRSKIQLEINFEPTSVFEEEDGVIKILADKTESEIPEKVFAKVSRLDGSWSSGNIEINFIGEIVTVQLEKGKSNAFAVTLYDVKGNKLECEPSSFNILQGGKGASAVLPYNIGIEIKNSKNGKIEFRTIQGLEKSKALPATGLISNVKIPKTIRPGFESAVFEVAIYQGEHGADGTRAIYNHHIKTIRITGTDLPALVPENSTIDIQIKVDVNQKITASITFPVIAFTFECECETVIDKSGEEKANYILNEIQKGFVSVNQLKLKGIGGVEIDKAEKDLEEIKSQFETDKMVSDKQQLTLANLRRVLKSIDELEDEINSYKSKDDLEDLLFKLTEDGLIPAKTFQEYYEQLSNMNGDAVLLEKLNNDIKAYESK
jgi:molecular chaperone DnaK